MSVLVGPLVQRLEQCEVEDDVVDERGKRKKNRTLPVDPVDFEDLHLPVFKDPATSNCYKAENLANWLRQKHKASAEDPGLRGYKNTLPNTRRALAVQERAEIFKAVHMIDPATLTPKFQRQLLIRSIRERNMAELNMWIEAGNDVNGNRGEALQEASSWGNVKAVVRLLAVPGIDVNADKGGALCSAVIHNHPQVVELLLASPGIDVNAWYGSALHIASEHGFTQMVERLLAVPGVDVNAGNGRALAAAAANGRIQVVERILAAPGVDVNAGNGIALQTACKRGHTQIVELLLAVPGIDVNAKGEGGGFALVLASSRGHIQIVERLLAAPNIDVNAVDGNGASALEDAVTMSHTQVMERLLAVPGIEVDRALRVADIYGYNAVVARLRAAGAK